MVVMPEVPGFPGSIKDAGTIKNIMGAQWRTINRGGTSIMVLCHFHYICLLLIGGFAGNGETGRI
jgi:hypothetical protein